MERTPVNIPAEPGAARQTGFRCVLLVKGGALAAPADLLLSLSKRAVEVTVCASPFEAMARIVSRRGSEADRPTALLVVEPDGLDRAEELARSVERFAPRVARWRYDDSAEPKLRGYALPKPEAAPIERRAEPGEGVGIPVRTASPPRLRLAGAPDSESLAEAENGRPDSPSHPGFRAAEGGEGAATGDPGESDGFEANIRAAELLTEEELAMLLADDGAPTRPGGGARAIGGGGEGGR